MELQVEVELVVLENLEIHAQGNCFSVTVGGGGGRRSRLQVEQEQQVQIQFLQQYVVQLTLQQVVVEESWSTRRK
jgi:hypothetical protein